MSLYSPELNTVCSMARIAASTATPRVGSPEVGCGLVDRRRDARREAVGEDDRLGDDPAHPDALAAATRSAAAAPDGLRGFEVRRRIGPASAAW